MARRAGGFGALEKNGTALRVAGDEGFFQVVQTGALIRRGAGELSGGEFLPDVFGKGGEGFGNGFARECGEDRGGGNGAQQRAPDFGIVEVLRGRFCSKIESIG